MTSEPGSSGTDTFRLMYLSHDRLDPATRKQALGELFSQARSNNKAAGISGALLLSGAVFVQTLEGDEVLVTGLYERICTDDRHDDVTLLEAGTAPERVFSRWSMARVAEDGESDIRLIAHRDGISPAASRRTTADQDGVLAAMRQAAARDPSGNRARS